LPESESKNTINNREKKQEKNIMPVYKKTIFYKNSRNCSKSDKILLPQETPISGT